MLAVTDLKKSFISPEGARVEVTCTGKRCPFKRRTATVNAKGNAYLKKFFKRKLRPKLTIDYTIPEPTAFTMLATGWCLLRMPRKARSRPSA